MIARIKLGGAWIHFGFPQSVLQPVPFFPYLVEVEPIADATGDETSSAAFTLSLRAQELIGLRLRGDVEILDKAGNVAFAGLVGRLAYGQDIRITVEA